MNMNDVMTIKEAQDRWGIEPKRLREKLNMTRRPTLKQELEEGLLKYYKSPGAARGEWIITTAAMTKWYGEEPKE